MLGAIAQGTTSIEGLLEGEDCLNTARALQQLGVSISKGVQNERTVWTVSGVGHNGLREAQKPLDFGNSGTGMRLMAGLLAGQNVSAELTGDDSLSKRPMERIAEPLRQMGVNIATHSGKPPLTLTTPSSLRGVSYASPVASAQVKSAILLAGLGAEGTTEVCEPHQSRDHTERLLPAFGCPVQISDRCVKLEGGAQLKGIRLQVPGDISSAAFFIVAASIIPGSDLLMRNVGINPTRVGVIKILDAMGANIELSNERMEHGEPVCDIRVRAANLHGIDVPPEWVPSAIDEFPAIFIAATQAHGRFRLSGAAELRVKESDRIGAMATGLKTLGIHTRVQEDGLEITGGPLGGGSIDSFDDHRIAMAFVVAGAIASAEVRINDVANVNTSFPGFADSARAVGIRLESF